MVFVGPLLYHEVFQKPQSTTYDIFDLLCCLVDCKDSTLARARIFGEETRKKSAPFSVQIVLCSASKPITTKMKEAAILFLAFLFREVFRTLTCTCVTLMLRTPSFDNVTMFGHEEGYNRLSPGRYETCGPSVSPMAERRQKRRII